MVNIYKARISSNLAMPNQGLPFLPLHFWLYHTVGRWMCACLYCEVDPGWLHGLNCEKYSLNLLQVFTSATFLNFSNFASFFSCSNLSRSAAPSTYLRKYGDRKWSELCKFVGFVVVGSDSVVFDLVVVNSVVSVVVGSVVVGSIAMGSVVAIQNRKKCDSWGMNSWSSYSLSLLSLFTSRCLLPVRSLIASWLVVASI